MLKRWLVPLLLVALGSPQPAIGADTVDTELATGVRQAQDGDFENAVVTLDGVVRRFSGQPSKARDLARAYTYLSIAYLGLGQEQTARAMFLEAWMTDPDMNLSAREFAPRILEFFAKAREEANLAAPGATTSSPDPQPDAIRSLEAKKKGSRTVPILIGVAILGGVGIAVAAGGGGGGPTPSPAPKTGPLAFRLSWTSTSDFDLRVVEPTGNEVSRENPASGTGGSLDRDLVCSPGVETISWPGTAPRGTYAVFANFSGACGAATSASFTITVSQGNSVVTTRTWSIAEGTQSQRFTFVH